jgi:hypothetical protein
MFFFLVMGFWLLCRHRCVTHCIGVFFVHLILLSRKGAKEAKAQRFFLGVFAFSLLCVFA